MDDGLYGQVWIGLLMIGGGLVGTGAAIAAATSAEMRRLVIRISVASWIGVLTFVAAVLGIPRPFGFVLVIPYGVFFAVAAARWGEQWQQLPEGRGQPHGEQATCPYEGEPSTAEQRAEQVAPADRVGPRTGGH